MNPSEHHVVVLGASPKPERYSNRAVRLLLRLGYRVTYIATGRYKAMGNSAEPLSDEARAYIRDRLDKLFGVFIEGVAAHRGVSAEKALAMADDARLYVGAQALQAGPASFPPRSASSRASRSSAVA